MLRGSLSVTIDQCSVFGLLGGKAYRIREGRSSRRGSYSKTWWEDIGGAISECRVFCVLFLTMFLEHVLSDQCGFGRERKREVLKPRTNDQRRGGQCPLDTHSLVQHI